MDIYRRWSKDSRSFFTKGEPTKNIWYYQPNIERNLGKTNPLNEKDLADFVESSKTKPDTENSWAVSVDDIDNKTWDLTVNNPNRIEEVDNRTPEEILAEIEELDKEAAKCIESYKRICYELAKKLIRCLSEMNSWNKIPVKKSEKKYSKLMEA